MASLDLSNRNVHFEELTLEEARDLDTETVQKITEWVDEAQADVFSGDFGQSYLVIRISKE